MSLEFRFPLRWLRSALLRGVTSAGLTALALCWSGCEEKTDGKVHVLYWEKWTGREGEAMQRVVDAFNRSQPGIVVEYLAMSQIDRKALLATAGGDPPDIVGMWQNNVFAFADRNALIPLDDFIRADHLSPAQWLERYYPVFGEICSYRGKVCAVVSTPTTSALHWNKALFRAAGLDPERPPRNLQELSDFSDKLTKRDASGAITQMGFLPSIPTWFAWGYPLWFGGEYWDGNEITIGTNPANLAAFHWVADYTRKYGLDSVKRFAAGFGTFSSPQDPFFSGQVAMVFQGVFLNNFINQYAPGMEYGCTPWPLAAAGRENFTTGDCDTLVIPRGAKHPREAWEFLKYVSSMNANAQSREELQGMELLCYGQEKMSPLRQWSPFFEQHNPHPYVSVFRDLAESPNARHIPKIGIWEEYSREAGNVFDQVRLLILTPEQAVDFCQRRIASSWSRYRRSIERRGELIDPNAPVAP